MMRGVDGVLQSISSICHFLALLLGGLRAEKISIAATAKKYEARIVHLDSMVTQLTQQVMSFGINDMFYGSEPMYKHIHRISYQLGHGFKIIDNSKSQQVKTSLNL